MSSYLSKRRIRYSFGKARSNVGMPNLISVQQKSYEEFLQFNIPKEDRKNQGLQNVFQSIFPISDSEYKAQLEYVSYELMNPKYDPNECIRRGVDYASLMKINLRLIIWDYVESTGEKEIKGIKEQEVCIDNIPLMTDKGIFVINGAQKVIVSQLHRSPGVFYTHDGGKGSTFGKYLYSARIIPYRGSWLDFEFDTKDILYFRIDRKRKMHITTLLRAMGYSKQEILREFYSFVKYKWKDGKLITKFDPMRFNGLRVEEDIVDAETNDIIFEKDLRVNLRLIKALQKNGNERSYIAKEDDLKGKYLAEDIVDKKTGEVLYQSAEEISQELIDSVKNMRINEISVLDINNIDSGRFIRDTLMLDKNSNEDQALADIYRVLRPGEPSTLEVAKHLFESIFFDSEKYSLSSVGRMKINKKHDLDISHEVTILTKKDIIVVIKHLLQLKCGNGAVDDIDSLANRRVRSVGELIETQFRMGLLKMQKSIVEKMSGMELDKIMPSDLVNSKPLTTFIRDFFNSSQLTQFMDQTNPLAETTHKRRLSALGPGGLSRDRAGFEVRDVHTTHYGRICPIETPEGQNIGLINSLATYADIDDYGFIETPYYKVVDGCVTDDIVYLTAIEEERYNIARSSVEVDNDRKIIDEIVTCHRKGEMMDVPKKEVDLIDVSPQQLFSVAASLIPFLENDDANRALMGSNMQRQAVPLLTNDAPLIGTGMERVVAHDSGAVLLAKRDGFVRQVDAKKIVIEVRERDNMLDIDIYNLIKYNKSNQGTCINQRPVVNVGDFVKSGDILADGPCTDMGELALGKNILIAFMPWNGYNFEDSILLSERLVKDDVYTSIHIEEYIVTTGDTRSGPEEITRDIPNVAEEELRHLDEVGVVNIGSKVKAGDILVGKVTPKAQSTLTSEEKLLKAIFGEKIADVSNASLRLPPGEEGTVVDVKIFTKRGVEKDERALSIERRGIEEFLSYKDEEVETIKNYVFNRIKDLLMGQKVITKSSEADDEFDVIVEEEFFNEVEDSDIFSIKAVDKNVRNEILKLEKFYYDYLNKLEHGYKENIKKLQSGDDLPQGVLKIVKVCVAKKLKIQAGDKMAGRHGNKGIVSKIVPIEEMPFLDNGQPVDIVLNPLGVPSRMNIGQILETHLGWASVALGKNVSSILDRSLKCYSELQESELRNCIKKAFELQGNDDVKISEYVDNLEFKDILKLAKDVSRGVSFATPVFDGAKEDQINFALEKAGLHKSGKVLLRDGETGEYFDSKVTVGYIYMLKLYHLVDDKMHARSIGPYSLVTQQPLGGKAHFGGQRVGEMEVWALEAYGAAYTLQEMLTVKSDDVTGRIKAYEAIIRGENSFEASLPESFKVMIKEIRSLGLNIEVKDK